MENKTLYIGIDESYDPYEGGNFVLNFFIVSKEKDVSYISTFLENFILKAGKEEVKYDKTNNKNIPYLLKKLKDIDYANVYCISKIENKKEILEKNYKNSLNLFSLYINESYPENNINIKIDTVAGEKFQKECIKIIRNNISNKKGLKIKFVSSKSSFLIQMSDLLAAINRLGSKSKYIDIIKKNKSL